MVDYFPQQCLQLLYVSYKRAAYLKGHPVEQSFGKNDAGSNPCFSESIALIHAFHKFKIRLLLKTTDFIH